MPDKMNAEIRTQWTAALRSGEYQQGRGQLRRGAECCCLGVLCELAVKAGIIPEGDSATSFLGDVEYGAEANDLHLPAEVMEWAGIGEHNPSVDLASLPEGAEWASDPTVDGQASLANLNDGGTPFGVIADIIDAQL
jgi:hypothetical protein